MQPDKAGSVFFVPDLAKIGAHATNKVATHAQIIPVIRIIPHSYDVIYCASPVVPVVPSVLSVLSTLLSAVPLSSALLSAGALSIDVFT